MLVVAFEVATPKDSVNGSIVSLSFFGNFSTKFEDNNEFVQPLSISEYTLHYGVSSRPKLDFS